MTRVNRALKQAIMKYPKTSALVLGCLITAALILTIEIVCAQIQPRQPRYEGGYPEKFLVPDMNLGYKAKANTSVRARKVEANGRVIFDVEYSTDAWGRRRTPVENAERRNRFLVFFGCSTTFGYGLNDKETLPYYVSELAPSYKPYNEALVGYGPQHMLAVLEGNDFYSSIGEHVGIVLCIGAWIHRAVPTNILFGGRHDRFPYYYMDETGQVIRNGSFKTAMPLTSLLYGLVRSAAIAQPTGFHNYLARPTDRDIRITAGIVAASANLVKRNFRGSAFYLVNPPGFRGDYEKLVRLTREAGVNVLDYSGHSLLEADKFKITGDGHPTAEYNQLLAELIARDLHLSAGR
jgi:hypothetical protein